GRRQHRRLARHDLLHHQLRAPGLEGDPHPRHLGHLQAHVRHHGDGLLALARLRADARAMAADRDQRHLPGPFGLHLRDEGAAPAAEGGGGERARPHDL
ncbi:MAG: hypothetical protein AVDCRST_MAG04-2598, partial [uncultured Acetobacteraceae bacterium]